MKKILIIPSWYPHAHNETMGSFFQEQAALLSADGYDITILFGKTTVSDVKDYYIHKVKGLIARTKRGHLQNDDLVQTPPAFSFTIPLLSSWSEKKKHQVLCNAYQEAFAELLETGWKPDIIHAQCAVDGGIAAMYLSSFFKIPFVIIEHLLFLLNNYSPFKRALIVKALETAHKVGAVSNHQKRCLLMNSIKCKPAIIWNFVDENKFQIAPIKSGKKFRILTIAYPHPIKDMETFFRSIAAFCLLCKDDAEIIVIGNNFFGDLSKANTVVFEALARKHNVYSKCILIPSLPRNEIAKILNTADAFVSTSIAETFGVAVREAMLCGVPVIATKSGGVEDSINEKTGVLVNIGDFDAIAHALQNIQNRTLTFDSEYIRNFVISQCGRSAFSSEMRKFYS